MTANGTTKRGDELKIVIVGDGGCGKTSLLLVYAKGDFPEKYAPSVFEKYVTTISLGRKEIKLNLYDTAGQEDYDRLRPLSYQEADLVLVCFDVTNPTSHENVLIKVIISYRALSTGQDTVSGFLCVCVCVLMIVSLLAAFLSL